MSEGPPQERDERAEAALKAIALWYRILGFAPGAVILSNWSPRLPLIYVVSLIVSGTVPAVVGWILGHRLSRFEETARREARSLHFAMLVASILLPIVGLDLILRLSPSQQVFTFWGGVLQFFMHLMAGSLVGGAAAKRVCTSEYRQRVEGLPVGLGTVFESPYFWVPLVSIILGALASVAMIQHGTLQRPSWLRWF